jgi:thymidylate synthase
MINFWRPEKFKTGALRPCLYNHLFTIVDGTLHLTSNQRSCDVACGENYNSLQVYMLLSHFAKISKLKAGLAKHDITNPHIYDIHIDAIQEQLSRTPLPTSHTFKMHGSMTEIFDDLVKGDVHARDYFEIKGYKHLGKINFDLVA